MLDKKLAEANKASRQHYLRLAAICGALFTVGVAGIWSLNFLSRHTAPKHTAPKDITVDAPHPFPEDAESPNSTASPNGPKTQKPADLDIKLDVKDENDPHLDNSTAEREAFIRALGDYDSAIKPRVETPGFEAWNSEEQKRLRQMHNQVAADFASGDTASASRSLDQLKEAATTSLQSWDRAFDDAMTRLDSALDAKAFNQARMAAQEAQRLKPGHEDARTALARIDLAVLVADAVENMRIARIEGDTEGEIAAIDAALALDPSLDALNTRHNALQQEIREQRFAAAMQAGFDALSRQETTAARQALEQAKKLDSSRDETRILATKLAALEQRMDVQKFLSQAAQNAQSGDWDRAHALYAQALVLAPEDPAAIQGHQQAKHIVSVQNTIDQLIAAPHRLSSPHVEKRAFEAMDQGRALHSLSPRLARSSRQLAALMEDYNRQIEIRLVSDGKTGIAIRGVGRVGLTTNKVIHLKPGRYTIEGHREGYISKLVSLDVPIDATMVEVTVICDERI